MKVRAELRWLIIGGTALLASVIGGMMFYCVSRGSLQVHLATLAILTTSGPLIGRVFEGLVQRRQRVRGLEMDDLAADDERLIARCVPLLMPISGATFSYFIMM